MEILGGFMVMMSILGFFLTVIWFVLPFVVFGIKGKVDRSLEILESLDRRIATLESRLDSFRPPAPATPDLESPVIPPSPTPQQPSCD